MKAQTHKKQQQTRVQHLAPVIILFAMFLGTWTAPGVANTLGGQIPQIPAFLPMANTVPPGKVTPIDGEWVISSLSKRIRIQAGRAFAVDPWTHMFVLKIQPFMVVIKDIVRVGPGQYQGQDLPLLGQWNAQLSPDGTLNVTVAGSLGPVNYALMPLSQDDPRAFRAEKAGKYQSDDDDSEEEYEEEYEEEEYEEEEYEEEYSDEEDEEEYEEEEYEEEAPRKVAAVKMGKARKGCKGKQIYLSGGACYSCPKGYKRFSPTRKMTHPKACTQRGAGTKKVEAKYLWQANGCPKGQFKHKGACKVCPNGTKRIHVAGADTGYCRVK